MTFGSLFKRMLLWTTNTPPASARHGTWEAIAVETRSGQYTTRQMRDYMAKRRGRPVSWKTLAEDAAILVAVAAGEVCEVTAANVLGCGIVEVRERVNLCLRLANDLTRTPPDRDLRLETWTVDAGANHGEGAR